MTSSFHTFLNVSFTIIFIVQLQGEIHPEDGGSKALRNADILPQHYTVSQPRRPRLESSQPWKPKTSHLHTRHYTASLANKASLNKLWNKPYSLTTLYLTDLGKGRLQMTEGLSCPCTARVVILWSLRWSGHAHTEDQWEKPLKTKKKDGK
jgi:hypothetical protein